ncbi:hypothetical protein [Mycolicibacterium fluoranthenivorans]|uniref:Uncharacterized protein n=1 Tax=Mycolicibacterium fluoranthenivorans TaxID=258505 RepID=A0A1G4VI03_9MYCO|nr:hypothetical protein [Mycolicibacterium fluoranthenivorans]SCX07076.1 hypothetical protein SAMN02799620_00969 [Mycolicibacterium fluoranthenivorans]
MEILIGAVVFIGAAAVGVFLILMAFNIALLLRLRSRIPQRRFGFLPDDPE